MSQAEVAQAIEVLESALLERERDKARILELEQVLLLLMVEASHHTTPGRFADVLAEAAAVHRARGPELDNEAASRMASKDAAWLRLAPMTDAEKEEQRRSFVAGNVGMSNPAVTREQVDQVADRMASEDVTVKLKP